MECVHLQDCTSLSLPDFAELAKRTKAKNALKCKACDSTESVWLCVSCGILSCGRYVKAHGLRHFEDTHKKHAVCMDTKETAVFCYACDDFIVNDTPDSKLDSIRSKLLSLTAAAAAASTDGGGVGSSSSSSSGEKAKQRPMRRSSTGSSGGGGRKRSQSCDSAGSSSSENAVPTKRARRAAAVAKSQLKNLVGLRNLGNTCFMSAVLQSLSNIQEFCRVLNQLPSLSSSSGGGGNNVKRETRNKNGIVLSGYSGTSVAPALGDGAIMTEELRKVLLALSKGEETKKAISPEALFHVIWKVVPRFRGYQQQDAHEFLRYMLDRLHMELLALLPSDLATAMQNNLSPYSRRRLSSQHSSHSLVTSIFGGMLQSEVTCQVCKASSKKHDPFLDLSIDIPNHFVREHRKSKDSADGVGGEKRKNCDLHDCLKKFTDVEELADSERFLCGRCNRKQPATKKFWIRRLPNVLCLHLKRFRWSSYSRTKLDTHVEFPLSGLDMTNYLLSNLHETRCSNAGSCLYDLAAVIVHHGTGAGSGHYTAFVTKNNNWFHFNDSTVLATDPETVGKSKAYILFYIQREFRLPQPT